jgi:hypothetical protein
MVVVYVPDFGRRRQDAPSNIPGGDCCNQPFEVISRSPVRLVSFDEHAGGQRAIRCFFHAS